MQFFLYLFAYFAASWHFRADYKDFQWATASAFFAIPIGIHYAKRFGMLFGLSLSYYLVTLAATALFYHGRYQHWIPNLQSDLLFSSCTSGLTTLFLFLGMCSLNFTTVKKVIPVYTVIHALGIILCTYDPIGHFIQGGRFPEGHGYCWFFDYSGMGGCSLACGLPFLIPENGKDIKRILGSLIVLIGIVLCRSAIPYGVTAMVIIGYFYVKAKHWMFLGVFPFLFAGFFVGAKIFDSSRRFEAYWCFLKGYWNFRFLALGSGPGTFKIVECFIQMKEEFMVKLIQGKWLGNWWPWAHSDILQTLMEHGVPGLVLLILLIGKCLWNTRKDARMFSLVLGLTSSAVFDYPMRYFMLAVLIMFALLSSLEIRNPKYQDANS